MTIDLEVAALQGFGQTIDLLLKFVNVRHLDMCFAVWAGPADHVLILVLNLVQLLLDFQVLVIHILSIINQSRTQINSFPIISFHILPLTSGIFIRGALSYVVFDSVDFLLVKVDLCEEIDRVKVAFMIYWKALGRNFLGVGSLTIFRRIWSSVDICLDQTISHSFISTGVLFHSFNFSLRVVKVLIVRIKIIEPKILHVPLAAKIILHQKSRLNRR